MASTQTVIALGEVEAISDPHIDIETTNEGGTGENETTVVTLVNATGGTWTLTAQETAPETTAALAYGISAANLKTALELLTNVGEVTIVKDGDEYTIERTGADAETDFEELTATATSLTGPEGTTPAVLAASSANAIVQLVSDTVTDGATVIVQGRTRGPLGQGASPWRNLVEVAVEADGTLSYPLASIAGNVQPDEIRLRSTAYTDGTHTGSVITTTAP